MNSISCIWLEFRKEKEKQTHNQTQPDPNSTQAQPKLPWKPNSNPALGPTCLAQLNPTRAQLPSSLARPISPAASAARPAHPRHPHAALSPLLTSRPHLSAPPSPSRRAATRSRDLRPKLPHPSFPTPTPRSSAVSFKPPAEPLRSSHLAAQTLATAARYPGARSRTTATVGERFLEQLLATGYTPVTLTLPPPPQERPAPIQGVQEPGAAPIRPSSASSATSRRRPSPTTFLRCISGHHNH